MGKKAHVDVINNRTYDTKGVFYMIQLFLFTCSTANPMSGHNKMADPHLRVSPYT